MRRLLLALALSVVLPVGAAAQVCVGQPALSATNMGSVGMGASFFDEGRTVGLDATVGSSLFGFGPSTTRTSTAPTFRSRRWVRASGTTSRRQKA
jgi:hypothetical protein